MAASKAQIRANNKFNASHYDRISLLVPKGAREIIKEYAKENDVSVNNLIIQLLEREIGTSF